MDQTSGEFRVWRSSRVKNTSGRNGNGGGKDPGKGPDSPVEMDSSAPGGPGAGSSAEKVNALRAAIAAGAYRVDSKKVAGKIIDDVLQEIRNRTR